MEEWKSWEEVPIMVIEPDQKCVIGPAAAADPSKEEQVMGCLRLRRPREWVEAKIESIKSPSEPESINALAQTARLPDHRVRVMTSRDD